MAVITPRLVLVCALPAVITLLTVFWTRRRRKPTCEKNNSDKPLVTEETLNKLSQLARCAQLSHTRNTIIEQQKSEVIIDTISEIQSNLKVATLQESVDAPPRLDENNLSLNETTFMTTAVQENQTIVSSVKVQKSKSDIVEEVLSVEYQPEVYNQNLIIENKIQETPPKMHVKLDENQLSAKLEQECHLSPQGGSISDLSERQNSPVNSDASFSELVEETKPRRSRASCRLSEESRDSAMGAEEEFAEGSSGCVLVEGSPSVSYTCDRTEFGSGILMSELQPLTNGESGCDNEDEVLESPPPSIYSDGHSEGSCDSGKGGSDIQVISNNDLAQVRESTLLIYEFELAQESCGRLIGRQGKHVNYIKNSSNANVCIKRHPYNSRLKLCAVQGTKLEIKNALELIRTRFPLSQYPALSLVQVNIPQTCGVMVPETLQLHLPEGVTCDVILSSMVSAGHFFVQQPTHPTYPSLNRLDTCMTSCYSQMDTPQLPQPIEVGVICSCPVLEGWFRAQVVNLYENSEECDVKFVDYGGYSCVPMTRLRQIRSDFMTLPFQASECYLANVKPASEGWSLEACATFEELAQGQILQSLVVGHADDGIPYVHLYRVQGVSTVFINRELVNRGVAQWLEAEM